MFVLKWIIWSCFNASLVQIIVLLGSCGSDKKDVFNGLLKWNIEFCTLRLGASN